MTSWAGILIIGVCFAIPVIVVVGVIGFSITRIRRDASPAGRAQLLDEAQHWLDQQVLSLVPWQPDSLRDISDSVNYKYIRFSSIKTWGTIAALSSDVRLLAFYTIQSWGNRTMLVRSSRDQWQMDWEGSTVHFMFNGEPFGTWTGDGTLYDASRTAIGSAQRLVVYEINNLPTTWQGRWDDVNLYGRRVGRIMAQRGLRNMKLGLYQKMPVVNMDDAEPGVDGERWLYALACVEVAHFNKVKTTINETHAM